MKSVLQTDNDTTTIIIRLIVGVIFLSEGVQKFILPLERGAGRFEKIGFYYPEFFSSLVGSFEIVCGILIIIGSDLYYVNCTFNYQIQTIHGHRILEFIAREQNRLGNVIIIYIFIDKRRWKMVNRQKH